MIKDKTLTLENQITNKYNLELIENGRKVIIEMSVEDRIQYEIEELEKMSEEEACRFYHVDNKMPAREGIIEYWRYIA